MPMFKGATHWKIWQLHFSFGMRVPISPNLRSTTRLNTHLQNLQYAAAKNPFKLPKQTWETWVILCKFFIHDNNWKNATMSCQFVAVSVRCGCHPILTVSKDCCLCWSTVLWITVVRYTQPPRRVFRGADGRFGVGNKNWLFILRTCPKAGPSRGPNIGLRKTNQMESLDEMISIWDVKKRICQS